ncbi:MAG: glycoside hydrolase family 127 protein [Thermoguttaceae bacterium]
MRNTLHCCVFLAILAIIYITETAAFAAVDTSKDYPIQPVLPVQVKVDEDSFWGKRLETNRTVTLPYCFEMCEKTGRIKNFENAGKVNSGEAKPGELTFSTDAGFDDSDVSKVIEGAAYVVANKRDPELEKFVNDLIEKYAKAQEKDGYLYTIRTINDPKRQPSSPERWGDIGMGHELYNSGHMYEAGVAWYEATGNRNLLEICLKNADLVCETFGPNGLHEPPGHQEIEIGLCKLYRTTGDKKYLDMAKFFLDQRGRPENRRYLFGSYSQDHMPVVEQDEPVGHSVRAMYMLMGMADVAALTGDESYNAAIDRLWENVVNKKMYITGGVGASGGHEGFGGDYELPNIAAYCETCAAIGNALWNWRMFLRTGDSKYMDVVELVLYNGFLSGISMDGKGFFYPNPLESLHGAKRAPWFGCSCCPTNVVRFVSEIPGMAYAVGERDGTPVVYVNLFIPGTAEIVVNDKIVKITQETDYPSNFATKISVEPNGANFILAVRNPIWRTAPVPSDLYRFVNNPVVDTKQSRLYNEDIVSGGSVEKIQFEYIWGVVPERVVANELVGEDHGKVAIMCGPIVYCMEGIDQPDKKVLSKMLPDDAKLKFEFRPDLLGGVGTITTTGVEVVRELDGKAVSAGNSKLTFIPYYAWAHRDNGGEMAVWIAREPSAAKPKPAPTVANLSKVTTSNGDTAPQINDQLEPKNSNDKGIPFWHTWPKHGEAFWVQYDFAEPTEVKAVEVYWLDETSSAQACKVPKSWKLLAKVNGVWKEVENPSGYGNELDKFNRTTFTPLKAEGLRIEADIQDNWCGGIFEWKVE